MELIVVIGIIVISWILSDIKIELRRRNQLQEKHNEILKDNHGE